MSIVSSRQRRDLQPPSNGRPVSADEAGSLQTTEGDRGKRRPDWPTWCRSLADGRRTRPLPAGGKNNHALLWGMQDMVLQTDTPALEAIVSLSKAETAPPSSRLLRSLWSTPREFNDAEEPIAALTLVAWARNIAGLAEVATEQAWWAMADRLAELSRRASIAPARGLLTDQLLSVELHLTLAHWFDGQAGLAPITDGAGLLEESLLAEVDNDGLPRDVPRQHWLPLLACWTRCLMLLQRAGLSPRADAGDRYQDFVESLLRLAGDDGSLVWPGQSSDTRQQLDEWRAAAAFVHARLPRAMNLIWPNRVAKNLAARRPASEAALPPPSGRSDRAAFAVLRPAWSAPRLIVDYSQAQFRLRLDRRRDVWLDGACPLRIAIDGRQIEQQSSWEEICWIADEDVDYLELQLELDDELRVERHILFAREDEFVFLADAVLGRRPAAIDYEFLLPLQADVSIEVAAETRELTLLKAGRRRAIALPLALDEWRIQRGRGEFTAQQGGLRLTQNARQATNLFAACFIDVSAKRLRRPLTWRRLTVAEERQTQPDDAAVGYRVQVGERQWLFYRSLEACGNRTLLGHNLVSEFLAARFSRKGVPETLIEIEAPANEHE